MKTIIDLCAGTGAWSKPYEQAGYNVIKVTLPEFDIFKTGMGVEEGNGAWLGFRNDLGKFKVLLYCVDIYGILFAPPCTYFSFARTNAKQSRNLEYAMNLVNMGLKIIHWCLFNLKNDQQKYSQLKFWALENPYFGMLKWFLGKPAFVFDPYEFGDAYKKRTALWGDFREPKKNPVKPRIETDHNHEKLPKFDYMKSKDIHPEYFGKYSRQVRRSITPFGFAKAFMEANP